MMRTLDDHGHLTEEAVVMIADGAPLADAAGAHHLDACDACAMRVADAALFSLAAHTALRDPRARTAAVVPSPVAQPAIRITPSPRWPLVAGAVLLLAVVVPTLAADAGNIASTGRFLRACAAVLARGVTQVAHREAVVSSSLGTWLLALAFASLGAVVARAASRSKHARLKHGPTNGALS